MQASSKDRRGHPKPLAETNSTRAVAIWLNRFVDGCLAGSLVLAPLFMGGRGAVGQLVFVLLSGLAALAWCARQSLPGQAPWRWSGAEWLLALGAGLVIAQLLPLPPFLLTKLVPVSHELLPLWTQAGSPSLQLGQWSTISLTPEATRGGLTMFLSYGLLFLVFVQRIRTVADVERLLRVLAFAAVLMAVVGLAQFLGGSDKFLGLYEHKSRSAATVVRGTFQNENHFAHFLSLGLGPLIWCLYRSREQRRQGHSTRARSVGWAISNRSSRSSGLQSVFLAGLVLVALAGLLTFSRGGVLTMAIALVTAVVVMRWKSLIDRRTSIALSVAAAVNLLAMFVFGFESLSEQMGSVFHATSFAELFDNRMDLWRAMCDGIANFYCTGSGVGSHSEVYPLYMEERIDALFTHGESGYLQILLETGVGGLLLMLLGIACSFRWCGRTLLTHPDSRSNDRPGSNRGAQSLIATSCACAVLPGLVASVVHSLADFVWYIPACMTATIALLAAACRLQQLVHSSDESLTGPAHRPSAEAGAGLLLPRTVWLALAVLLTLATLGMGSNRIGPAFAALDWNAYLKLSIVRPGATPLTPSQERDRLAAMEEHLRNVLRHEPRNGRAHLRLASVYLKQFEIAQRSSDNSMELSQYRDAAQASHFASKEAQDAWLNVAIGETRGLLDQALVHSHRAVALSPLQGRGYVLLASLCFLESPRPEWKAAYIQQAIRVRPHDGLVLFTYGKEAAQAGDSEEALRHLKRAFQIDPEIRQVIVELMDPMPAAEFVEGFEPNTSSLGQLFQRYQASGRLDEAKWVGLRLVSALERDASAKSNLDGALEWQQAQAVYTWLGDGQQALRCQQRAVDLAPLNFDVRHTFAQLLAHQRRHADAIQQLEWCLRRQPDNEQLRSELADLKLQQLQHSHVVPASAHSSG